MTVTLPEPAEEPPVVPAEEPVVEAPGPAETAEIEEEPSVVPLEETAEATVETIASPEEGAAAGETAPVLIEPDEDFEVGEPVAEPVAVEPPEGWAEVEESPNLAEMEEAASETIEVPELSAEEVDALEAAESAPVLAEQEEDFEVGEPVAEPVAVEPPEGWTEVEESPAPAEMESATPVTTEVPDLSAKEIDALETAEIVEEEPAVAEPTAEAEPQVALEPAVADQPVAEAGEDGVADLMAAPPPAETVLPVVRLTLEDYSERLNGLEEGQRSLLNEAIARQDDGLRDRLQRELVIMNNKLAQIADSYVEEVACLQQVLDLLEQMRGELAAKPGLEAAIDGLRAGDPKAAEEFLTGCSQERHAFTGPAAFACGRLAESRVDLHKALAHYRLALEQEPENPAYLQAAGRTARSLYRYKEALPWLESFVRLFRQSVDSDPVALALAQRELAYTYVLSGQHQKAGPLYKEAMTALARKLGQDHPEMAISWQQIGELQETLGEYDKAVSLYRKALEIMEKKRGPEHPAQASILAKLAALCMELEMEPQAVPLYERLVRIQEKALRPTHPQLAISLNNLAESYRLQGRYGDAEACYRKTLAINEATHGPEHPSVAAVLQELAKLATSQRKPEEARQYQERAAAIFQKSVEAAERKSGNQSLTLEL